jgi:hypothetical protein
MKEMTMEAAELEYQADNAVLSPLQSSTTVSLQPTPTETREYRPLR